MLVHLIQCLCGHGSCLIMILAGMIGKTCSSSLSKDPRSPPPQLACGTCCRHQPSRGGRSSRRIVRGRNNWKWGFALPFAKLQFYFGLGGILWEHQESSNAVPKTRCQRRDHLVRMRLEFLFSLSSLFYLLRLEFRGQGFSGFRLRHGDLQRATLSRVRPRCSDMSQNQP